MNILVAMKKISLPKIKDLQLDNSTVTQCINKIMIMMASIARKATGELVGIFPVPDVEKLLQDSRKQLDDHVEERFKLKSEKFHLTNDYPVIQPWCIKVPVEPEMKTVKDEKKIFELANTNIASLPLTGIFNAESPDYSASVTYVKFLCKFQLNGTSAAMHNSLVLHTIENIFHESALHLNKSDFRVPIKSIETLVNEYRTWNRKYLAHVTQTSSDSFSPSLVVELLSNEMLIMWTGFALIHKALKQEIPLLSDYGVTLKWADISVLVLSKKSAQIAALKLSEYLKENSKEGKELFFLSGDQSTTMEFALNFAKQSRELLDIWEDERTAAAEREEEQWLEIVAKQKEVARLQADEATIRNDLKELVDELDDLNKEFLDKKLKKKTYLSKRNRINSKITKLRSKLKSTESSIVKNRKSPAPIFQPLPKDESLALTILFFLHMPEDLKLLARMALSARQILIPNSDFCSHSAVQCDLKLIDNALRVNISSWTSWKDYYNTSDPCKESVNEVFRLYSEFSAAKSDHIGHRDVLSYRVSSEAVWHPDKLHPVILWNGGGFSLDSRNDEYFNPFVELQEAITIEYFTEKVADSLQFTMTQYGKNTKPTRSNEAIAKPQLQPSCMSKLQWLTFANLRAYPHQQLRKICCALNDRSLPFDQPLVHTLFRQILYHIGDVAEFDHKVCLLWKKDMTKEFFTTIAGELARLGSDIAAKPSQQTTMLILIEAARYFGQWSEDCTAVVESFVAIIKTWITDCDNQISQAGKKQAQSEVRILREKRALFYNYAVICFCCEKLIRPNIRQLLKFLVLAQNEARFKCGNLRYDDQVRVVTVTRHRAVTSRIHEIFRELEFQKDRKILTEAVREIITDAPPHLEWGKLQNTKNGLDESFFVAVDAEENIYCINVMNGIVLCNGVPPSELPLTILNHPLYKRVFSDHTFETRVLRNVIRTIIPQRDCLYSFSLEDQTLTIKEKNIESHMELRLLDGLSLANEGSWGFDLPIILRENYSHWYCEAENVILLRGISFFDVGIEFILKLDENQWRCFRIPFHRKDTIWKDYLEKKVDLELFDELVTLKSPILDILEKFESAQYIHCYKSQDGLIRYHYPRFDLEFYCNLNLTEHEFRYYSRDYFGFHLRPNQQLHDTLLGFQRYLILQHNEIGKPDTKIAIPQGKVSKSLDMITVETKDGPKDSLKVYTYEVHPVFQTLQATNVHARIHLADLYAACSTLLPESRSKMCGSEVAMQLVRRSRTNQPLEETDYEKLNNLCKHSNFTPGLDLLSYEVACSSLQTQFLHPEKNNTINLDSYFEFPETASVEYMHERVPRNVRTSLTSNEEIRLLGGVRPCKLTKSNSTAADPNDNLINNVIVLDCKVEYYEKILFDMIDRKSKPSQEDFVLKYSKGPASKLHDYMFQTLQKSFEAHLQKESLELRSEFFDKVSELFRSVKKEREQTEDWIFNVLTEIPESCGNQALVFRIFRSVNIYPLLTLEDIVRCAISKGWLQNFNPFLSKECSNAVYQNILTWMMLRVLENKMNRLLSLMQQFLNAIPKTRSNKTAIQLNIIQEILTNRSWSVESYPCWLAFEVVTGLQIRPIQYTVANSIINGLQEKKIQGPITQLNMGEGKTRVILPMLALYWRNSDNLVRFNFLPALLQEAGEYLRNILSATVLDIPVYNFAFNRDVHLDSETADSLVLSLRNCLSSGGVVLCAPEHRLSLKLKSYELMICSKTSSENDGSETCEEWGHVCEKLKELDSLKFLDILDEVDEILRTKNKLIYSVGSQEKLPSIKNRLTVLQSLLGVVASNSLVQHLLSYPFVTQGKVGQVNGCFQEFRILSGQNFDEIKNLLNKILAEKLISDPPFELRWLEHVGYNGKNVITACVIEEHMPHFDKEIFHSSHLDDMLALRGFLAYGLFAHCLMRRNRVDYGVNRLAGKNKLIAVPFKACETPSLRAEFGHPDCALMYTCLAYYYDGLSFEQVEEAFKILLHSRFFGDNAQKAIYDEWLSLSSPAVTSEELLWLDDVAKLDLSNSILVSLLFKHFSKNMKTINFWLNNCVFENVKQFPYRLEATAWDLAHNSYNQVAGFSGTNDDRLIMPSSLRWVEQTDLELLGTDGKMLQLLEKSTFESLQIRDEKMTWKLVLDAITEKVTNDKTHVTCALIDAGALMAGAYDNTEVARYLAECLNKGVIYFDMNRNAWWVRDKLGREWPKHSSPINERDGFVYFDESRTRGADMKLNCNACAVLTLGPDMCKDKLMQAAGRMRMLEHGQKIHMVATEDVASKIKNVKGSGDSNRSQLFPIDILQWVMSNTVENIAKWLPEWASQGGKYYLKKECPETALIAEDASLETLYGHDIQKKTVKQIWGQNRSVLEQRCVQEHNENERIGQGSEIGKDILVQIDERIERFGSKYQIKAGLQLEEECEREVEAEVELEQELEKEIPSREPSPEKLWNIENLQWCSNPLQLYQVIEIQTLGSFIGSNVHFKGKRLDLSFDANTNSFPHLKWPPTVYGTRNFFQTVLESSAANKISSSLNDYLRLVDNFVVFKNGEVLLLSEREADEVLRLTWTSKCDNFVLLNLTYTRKRKTDDNIIFQSPQYIPIGSGQKFSVSDEIVAALSLFQGLVMFPNESEKIAVAKIVSTSFAKQVAPIFSEMRGLGVTYARSDLHTICTQ